MNDIIAPPRPNHVMVDLETFGVQPGSVIVSIGAVAFDPVSSVAGETFYAVIDPADAQRCGLTLDAKTVLWWLGRSEAARQALTVPGMPMVAALHAFSAFWRRVGGTRFWGHGGNFDEPLLSAAYRVCGIEPPWQFYDSRCTRTIFDLAGVKPERDGGTHHNALDDAKAQADAVARAYAILRERQTPTLVKPPEAAA
ncbi:3'-5' exonuclease [Phenylobacterium sp.]|uniref:3'-5' exonuclease n=1 Tax=Phenylobacterium sp. TaxID=1871053 RepID=UPI002F3F2657